MKCILLCLLFYIQVFNTGLFSQNYTQTIYGKVTDKETDVAIEGVYIIIANTNPVLGAISDINGKFNIAKVPIGRQTLKASFMGYEDMLIPEILITTGKQVSLDIKLNAKTVNINTVEIKADKNSGDALNSMSTISSRTLVIDDASRYAGGFGDPARMASSFAGVATTSDEMNEIVIRGNSPQGLLWRLEGIDIPNPNHFTSGDGGSGGAICMLSNNVLANSDFFSGAFPADYGDALSGVFDLNMRKGNSQKDEYTVQVGVLGTEVAAEGPFAKGYDGSFLFNYQYSNFTLLHKLGVQYTDSKYAILPTYQDFSYNIYLPTKNFGNFTLFGFGGASNAGQSAPDNSALWLTDEDHFENYENHRTAVFGLTHTYLFKDNRTWLKTVAAFTYEQNTWTGDSLNNSYQKVPIDNESYNYPTYKISTTLNHKFSTGFSFRAGVTYDLMGYNLSVSQIDTVSRKYQQYIDSKGYSGLFQSFAEMNMQLAPYLNLVTGLHYLYFALNGHQNIEPRLGLDWKFQHNQSFNLGLGLHSKIESISNYMVEIPMPDGSTQMLNKDLSFSKAAHIVLGYNNKISDVLHFKAEAYYQYLYDIPVDRDVASSFSLINEIDGVNTDALINKGTGYNYGLELTLERFFSNNYYFLVTASLFSSKYRGSDGILRNTAFDDNYITNFLIGKDFKAGKNKQDILSLNIKFILKGGDYYTPIDLDASIRNNEEILVDNSAFTDRSPAYMRLDFGIKYRHNFSKVSFVSSIDVQNLTDNKNIYNISYNPDTKSIQYINFIGIIPIINFRLEF